MIGIRIPSIDRIALSYEIRDGQLNLTDYFKFNCPNSVSGHLNLDHGLGFNLIYEPNNEEFFMKPKRIETLVLFFVSNILAISGYAQQNTVLPEYPNNYCLLYTSPSPRD